MVVCFSLWGSPLSVWPYVQVRAVIIILQCLGDSLLYPPSQKAFPVIFTSANMPFWALCEQEGKTLHCGLILYNTRRICIRTKEQGELHLEFLLTQPSGDCRIGLKLSSGTYLHMCLQALTCIMQGERQHVYFDNMVSFELHQFRTELYALDCYFNYPSSLTRSCYSGLWTDDLSKIQLNLQPHFVFFLLEDLWASFSVRIPSKWGAVCSKKTCWSNTN